MLLLKLFYFFFLIFVSQLIFTYGQKVDLRTIKVVANLEFMYTNVPLIKRYSKAAKMGFKLVEIPFFIYEIEVNTVKKEAEKFGIKHVMINSPAGNLSIGEVGFAAMPKYVNRFRKSLEIAIKYAKELQISK